MNAIRKWIADHPETGGAGRLFVYCLVDDGGETIYVGSTANLHQRLGRHAAVFGDEVRSVRVSEYYTRDDMLATESSMICRLNPKHNLRGRTDLPDRKINRWGTAREVERARNLRRQAEIIEAATAERNRLMVEATSAGASTREIAEAAGLSNVGVWRIVQRTNAEGGRR